MSWGRQERALHCLVTFAVSLGGGGKDMHTEGIWPPYSRLQKPRSFHFHFLLGRKCSYGLASLTKTHRLRSWSFPSSGFKVYPVPLLQGIFRNATGMVTSISSCLFLQHLTLHSSSTPDNRRSNSCKRNLILIAVIPLNLPVLHI